MWVVAGVLLGLMVLVGLVGFHTGPHTHFASGVVGLLAGGWLVAMAVDGTTRTSLLFALLAADLVVSGGMAFAAWRGLASRRAASGGRLLHSVEGSMGVAVGGLSPSGVVRVRGESWSATSLNGPVPDGAPIQVISIDGVRLNVWGEEIGWSAEQLEAQEQPQPAGTEPDGGDQVDTWGTGRSPSGPATGGIEL